MQFRLITANMARSGTGVRDLVGQRPDMVCLQEVDVNQWRSRFRNQAREVAEGLKGLGLAYWRFLPFFTGQSFCRLPAGRMRAGGPAWGGFGVMIASRYPVRTWRALRLGAGPVRVKRRADGRRVLDLGQNRGLLAADVLVRGRRLRVATTHLEVNSVVARRQLVRAWNHVAAPGPAVLCGDFNLGPTAVESVGLPAQVIAHAPTFPAPRPRKTIDYVVGSHVEIGAVETFAVDGSDHLGIIAEMRV
ncbi:MAG: endonuclease/exonuclease/phosphatase family protein [Actinomycetaceae bacterium]|nr:endonuclease/exonuclease/phosphatase family protein [Actinomycetaceae bacterium]